MFVSFRGHNKNSCFYDGKLTHEEFKAKKKSEIWVNVKDTFRLSCLTYLLRLSCLVC